MVILIASSYGDESGEEGDGGLLDQMSSHDRQRRRKTNPRLA